VTSRLTKQASTLPGKNGKEVLSFWARLESDRVTAHDLGAMVAKTLI
jgi:hypothetical protein